MVDIGVYCFFFVVVLVLFLVFKCAEHFFSISQFIWCTTVVCIRVIELF